MPSESQEDILASLVKAYGKPVYNCCPGYNSAGDFAQWLAERVKGLQAKIALLEKHNHELLAELELHRRQGKVSAKEGKTPRGPDLIRQEFEAIVSCIDPLTVNDGINEDTYERQILIRCVAAATTLLKMHFDEEIKRIEQTRQCTISTDS